MASTIYVSSKLKQNRVVLSIEKKVEIIDLCDTSESVQSFIKIYKN